jgi:hypothetical protein
MKKIIVFALSILGLNLLFAKQALAVCPICTIAVGAGVGFSRWLGIDDSITGLWIGGLTVSMITWTLSWFDKKNIRFRGRALATTIGYYLLIVVPLYFMGIMGSQLDTICACGLDKLIVGIIVGSIAFWFGAEWYYTIKEKNGGHAYFLFQKVVMPVSPLVLLSIIFYFLTK